MKLIIHIGAHKTASSLIQKNLERLGTCLLERKVHYPTVQKGIISHHDMAKLLNQGKTNQLKKYLNQIIAEAKSNESNQILLSSEMFSLNQNEAPLPDEISSKFEEVTVICYTRNQLDLLDSLYNQNVKSAAVRYKHDIETFFHESKFSERYDYNSILKQWKNINSPTNVIFIPFEESDNPTKSLLTQGLNLDSSILKSIKHEAQKGPLINKSLNNSLIPLLRYSNTKETPQALHKYIVRQLKAKEIRTNYTLISQQLAKQVESHFAPLNAQLNQSQGYNAVTETSKHSKKVILNESIEVDEKELTNLLTIAKRKLSKHRNTSRSRKANLSKPNKRPLNK